MAWAWKTRKKASKLGKNMPGPEFGGGNQWDGDPGFGESIKGEKR